MKNRKMLSILGMMFILCSVISCKGDDKPGTGVNPADRDLLLENLFPSLTEK